MKIPCLNDLIPATEVWMISCVARKLKHITYLENQSSLRFQQYFVKKFETWFRKTEYFCHGGSQNKWHHWHYLNVFEISS